jgi:hypothetical protein
MKLFWVACWLSSVERIVAAVLTPQPVTLIRLYAYGGASSSTPTDDVAVLLFHGQCWWQSLVPNHSDRNDTAMLVWNNNNNNTVEDDSIQACCNASVVAISNIRQHNIPDDDDDDDDAMRIVLRSVSLDPIEQIRAVCLQSIARIVSSALLLNRIDDDDYGGGGGGGGLDQHHMLPTSLYSFVYSKTITHPTRTLSTSSSSSYLSSILPPPPYHLTLVTQKQYQFHAHRPELFRLVTDDDVAVRMESTTPLKDRYSFFIFHPRNATNTQHPLKAYPWRIQLWTNLSETGGMHRDMYHTLQFQPPPPPPLLLSSSSSSSLPFPSYIHNNISLYMLLHIPSDLYLNVEDCFRWEKQQDRFTSHRADGTNHRNSSSSSSSSHMQIVDITVVPNAIPHYVIDQEEPAFASPSHAILVHIQLLFTVHDDHQQQHQDHLPPTVLTVEFATKLHVRYPPTWAPPSPPRNVFDPHYHHHHHNFRSVIIPPPILVSGTIVPTSLDDDDDDTNHDRSRPILPRRIPYDPLVLPAKAIVAPQLLQLWVAPGHQSHFLYVVWVTITVAMIGSIRMLQDISFVSVWG